MHEEQLSAENPEGIRVFPGQGGQQVGIQLNLTRDPFEIGRVIFRDAMSLGPGHQGHLNRLARRADRAGVRPEPRPQGIGLADGRSGGTGERKVMVLGAGGFQFQDNRLQTASIRSEFGQAAPPDLAVDLAEGEAQDDGDEAEPRHDGTERNQEGLARRTAHHPGDRARHQGKENGRHEAGTLGAGGSRAAGLKALRMNRHARSVIRMSARTDGGIHAGHGGQERGRHPAQGRRFRGSQIGGGETQDLP